MKHARSAALDRIEPLLQELRSLDGLTVTARGVFSRRSRAFLHFHEDPTGVYADVRLGDDFERLPATSADEQEVLLARVRAALTAPRDGQRTP